MKKLPHFIILISIFFACKDTPEVTVAILPPTPTETIALFFKKEKKIEIWSSAPSKQLLKTLKDIKLFEVEIGVHEKVSQAFFQTNNYISKISRFNPSKVIVLPNDPRPTGQLEPCFACSHSTVEIYAKIELLIKDYPINK